MKLLHIIATPRGSSSHTLPTSAGFIDRLAAARSDLAVETVDLYHADLPAAAGTNVEVKYGLMGGLPVDPSYLESWHDIESLIEQFLSSDVVLITTPMWNFGIPYALKYYIDCLVQPGYLFRYDDLGVPVPLVHGKTLVVVSSRGGDYSVGPMSALDFQEPYLRAIFGFVGVTDVEFVNLQPMDVNDELREAAVAGAAVRLAEVAARLAAGAASVQSDAASDSSTGL